MKEEGEKLLPVGGESVTQINYVMEKVNSKKLHITRITNSSGLKLWLKDGLLQKDVAAHCNISVKSFRRWESEAKHLRPGQMIDIKTTTGKKISRQLVATRNWKHGLLRIAWNRRWLDVERISMRILLGTILWIVFSRINLHQKHVFLEIYIF